MLAVSLPSCISHMCKVVQCIGPSSPERTASLQHVILAGCTHDLQVLHMTCIFYTWPAPCVILAGSTHDLQVLHMTCSLCYSGRFYTWPAGSTHNLQVLHMTCSLCAPHLQRDVIQQLFEWHLMFVRAEVSQRFASLCRCLEAARRK